MSSMSDALRKQGLIPASEAAKVAGVSIYTIYNWISGDKVRGRRVAEHWFVDYSSLEEFVGKDNLQALQVAQEGRKG
jgi:hypothetical protein